MRFINHERRGRVWSLDGRKVGKDISVVVNRKSFFSLFFSPSFLSSSERNHFSNPPQVLVEIHTGNIESVQDDWEEQLCGSCEPGYISSGGGWVVAKPPPLVLYLLKNWFISDGHYGLYLDDTLYDGSSAPCPTFDNEAFCSPGPKKGRNGYSRI